MAFAEDLGRITYVKVEIGYAFDAGSPQFVKCLVDHRPEHSEVGAGRVQLGRDDDLVLVDDGLRRVALDEAGA